MQNWTPVTEDGQSKPFNSFVSDQVTQICYHTFSIDLLSYIARHLAKNFMRFGFDTDNLNQFWADCQAFILMAKRKISLNVLFERVDLTLSNLSILQTGKAKAICFSNFYAIYKVLDCQLGDILEYGNDEKRHFKMNFI